MKSTVITRAAIGGSALLAGVALVGCGDDQPASEPADSPPVVTVTRTAGAPQTSPPPASASEPPGAPTVAADVYRKSTGYFFRSPSGKWSCAILTNSGASVGCHGPLPKSAPDVAAHTGGGTRRPNTLTMLPGEAAKFISRGDPAYSPSDGTEGAVLPYGRVLRVGTISCRIAQTTGVTCDDTASGHGFTLSNAAFDLR